MKGMRLKGRIFRCRDRITARCRLIYFLISLIPSCKTAPSPSESELLAKYEACPSLSCLLEADFCNQETKFCIAGGSFKEETIAGSFQKLTTDPHGTVFLVSHSNDEVVTCPSDAPCSSSLPKEGFPLRQQDHIHLRVKGDPETDHDFSVDRRQANQKTTTLDAINAPVFIQDASGHRYVADLHHQMIKVNDVEGQPIFGIPLGRPLPNHKLNGMTFAGASFQFLMVVLEGQATTKILRFKLRRNGLPIFGKPSPEPIPPPNH